MPTSHGKASAYMDGMTPEERFTRIENLLNTVGEDIARHDAQIERNVAQIEKNAAAIRDLIIVSRTLLESQAETKAKFDQTADQQREWDRRFNADMDRLKERGEATDERLNILIETVDRIIRERNEE
jgi:hypothetical protein